MPDISYTDTTHLDIGVLKGARLDLEYGDTGNDFELTLDIDSEQRLEIRSLSHQAVKIISVCVEKLTWF